MHKNKSTLKSRFFLKLFTIPLICWIVFFLVAMLIPDDPGQEPLTWLDFFETTLFLAVIWFIISFMIAFIVNKIKKNVPDTPMLTAQTNIERNPNDKCFHTNETVMNANPDNMDRKQYRHTHFIKGFMILLFILTLFSFLAASWSVTLVDFIHPRHGLNTVKNTWVFWCWLPIPILSIVLGFKYNHAGFKCTKNIVAGFIIGFLLAVYGSFCLFPTFSEDYQKISAYEPYIDADLPENGELDIQDWGHFLMMTKQTTLS